jgi:hypothetical protein
MGPVLFLKNLARTLSFSIVACLPTYFDELCLWNYSACLHVLLVVCLYKRSRFAAVLPTDSTPMNPNVLALLFICAKQNLGKFCSVPFSIYRFQIRFQTTGLWYSARICYYIPVTLLWLPGL